MMNDVTALNATREKRLLEFVGRIENFVQKLVRHADADPTKDDKSLSTANADAYRTRVVSKAIATL